MYVISSTGHTEEAVSEAGAACGRHDTDQEELLLVPAQQTFRVYCVQHHITPPTHVHLLGTLEQLPWENLLSSLYLIMLIDKSTPVQQLDGSLEAEDGVVVHHLGLLLWHLTLPLCIPCCSRTLCPCKELHPFL